MTGDALGWVCHPVTAAAALVLLVIDHVLKAALGTWWTGKLSDVAGLVVAPALLSVLLRLLGTGRGTLSQRGMTCCVLAVGSGFVLVKATVVGARFATAVWSVLTGSAVVRPDPTDLVALPALAVAWVVGRQVARRRGAVSRVRGRTGLATALLGLAVLATAATSMAPTVGIHEVVAKGELLVVEGTEHGWGDAFRLTVDGRWHPLTADESDRVVASSEKDPTRAVPDRPAGVAGTPMCVGAECYRASHGRPDGCRSQYRRRCHLDGRLVGARRRAGRAVRALHPGRLRDRDAGRRRGGFAGRAGGVRGEPGRRPGTTGRLGHLGTDRLRVPGSSCARGGAARRAGRPGAASADVPRDGRGDRGRGCGGPGGSSAWVGRQSGHQRSRAAGERGRAARAVPWRPGSAGCAMGRAARRLVQLWWCGCWPWGCRRSSSARRHPSLWSGSPWRCSRRAARGPPAEDGRCWSWS